MEPPFLSVAMLAGLRRDRAQRLLDAVARQSAIDRLEVVVIDLAPQDARPLRLPPGCARSAIIPAPGGSLSWAKAEAVRATSSESIAFLEEHCYPEPQWARTLIEAQRGPWAAIGYAFTNANPESYVGRSSMLADYGRWAHPARSGPARFLPGNNVLYRRSALEPFGSRLEPLLGVDFNAQDALRRAGHELYVEAGARTAHENFTRLGDLCRANAAYCRLLAVNRARLGSWGIGRRLLYAALVPVVVPFLKLARLARALWGRWPLAGQALLGLPVFVATFVWASLGEARGYLEEAPEAAELEFAHWELEASRAD